MLDAVYGDGTITRRADGRLQVTVTVDGRRRYAMVPARLVAKDPKAAARLAEKRRRELLDRREGALAGSSQTLEAFLRSWIESLDRARVRRVAPRTLEGYRQIVEDSIIPTLGRRRLDRLDERHVQAWIDGMDASAQTIANRRAVLRRALNTAVGRLVPRNVAAGPGVELPKVAEFEGRPLTLDEVKALIASSPEDPLHALWLLAIDTGWREGELLGLARDDVDVEARTVTLSSQIQRVRGRGVMVKGEKRDAEWVRRRTKRPRQLATVAVSRATADALAAHLVRTAAERQPEWAWFGLLFLSPNGKPIGNREVLRLFRAACRKAGIEERRVHDLRGTSATILRELGVPEDIRMLRHGHATTRMARRYAQPRTGVDRTAADALGTALGGGTGGSSDGSPAGDAAQEA